MSEAEKSLDQNAAASNLKCQSESGEHSNSDSTRADRLSAVAAANKSMTFIEESGKDKTIRIRLDDTRSAILMAASLVLLLTSCGMVASNPDFRDAGIAMVLAADLLCGASILWYCILRFGFIRRIEPRFALICWHLVLGTGVLFSFIAMNVMLALFTMSRTQP